MTKKDFELIARVLRAATLDDTAKADLVLAMAQALDDTNPYFNQQTFIRACYPATKIELPR